MEHHSVKFVQGDITKLSFDIETEVVIVPHCCNDIGLWGAGVSGAIGKKWEAAKKSYQHFISIEGKYCLGKVDMLEVEDSIWVANMIGQHKVVSLDNPRPVKYYALCDAMRRVRRKIEDMVKPHYTNKTPIIIAPRFGSGLAGGNADFITDLMQEIWVDKGVSVTVYEF